MRLATNKINKLTYAVKTISKEKIRSGLHFLRNELEILRKLDHPNIVKFNEIY